MAKSRSNYLEATEFVRDRKNYDAGLKQSLSELKAKNQAALAAKKKAEEEKKKAEEEARKKAEAEVAAKNKKEAEAKRIAAEKAAREANEAAQKQSEKTTEKASKNLTPKEKIDAIAKSVGYNPMEALAKKKEQLFGLPENELNAALEAYENELKYRPKNLVEQGMQNTLDPSAYEKYKQEKDEYQKLQEKTYAGLRNYFHSENVKEGNVEIKDTDAWYKKASKGLWNGLNNVVSGVTSFATAGIARAIEGGLTPKEEARMKELERKVMQVEAPVRQAQLNIIKEEYEKVKKDLNIKNADQVVSWDKSNKTLDILNMYENVIDEYENASVQDGAWSKLWKGFSTDRLGVRDIGINFRAGLELNKLREKGEENLTPEEKAHLRAYDLYNTVKNSAINSDAVYNVSKGFRQSVEFIGETILGGRIVKGAVGGLVKGISPATKLGRAVDFGQELLKPIAMPTTSNEFMQSRNSDFVSTMDAEGNTKLVHTKSEQLSAQESLYKDVVILSSKINQLNAKDDLTPAEEAMLNDLEAKRQFVEESLQRVSMPIDRPSLGKSLASSYQKTLVENFSERYVGALWDKAAPLVGNTLSKMNPIGHIPGGSRLIDITTSALDAARKNRKHIDDMWFGGNMGPLSESLFAHVGPGKIIHSFPGEMLEEIAVQLTPIIGEDYVQQVGGLAEADFYTNLFFSTAMLSGSTSALGGMAHYSSMITNQEYRDNYNDQKERKKLFKDQYHTLDQAVDNEGVAQALAMGVPGSIYDIQDYQAKIALLRDPKVPHPFGLSNKEKREQASHLEKTALMNMALHAVQTGSTKQFKKALNKLTESTDIDPETVLNARLALQKTDRFQEIYEEHEGWANKASLVDLQIRKELGDFAQENLENQISAGSNEYRSILKSLGETAAAKVSDPLAATQLEQDFNNALELARKGELGSANDTVLNAIIESAKTNSKMNKFLDYAKTVEDVTKSNKEIQEKLDYELDPKNYKEIVKREQKKRVEAAKSKVNMKNVQQVIDELSQDTPLDFEAISELHQAAIQESFNPNSEPVSETDVEEFQGGEMVFSDMFADNNATQENVEENSIQDNTEGIPAQENIEEVDNNIDEEPPMFEMPLPAANQQTSSEDIQSDPSGGMIFSDELTAALGWVFDNEGPEIEEEDYDSYAMAIANPSDPNVKGLVDKLSPLVSQVLGQQPGVTFETFVASLVGTGNIGPVKVKDNFDAIRRSWEKGSGEVITDNRVNNLYNSMFVSDTALNNIANVFSGTSNSTVETSVATEEQVEVTDSAGETAPTQPSSIITEGTVMTSGMVPVKGTERRYSGIGLKLGGVLGIEYNRDPKTGEYTDVNDDVLESAKAFMDYRNFNPGDTVDIVFHTDYILDNDGDNVLSVWEDVEAELPTKIKTTFRKRLVEIFGGVEGVGLSKGKKLSEEAAWQNIKSALEDYRLTNSPDNVLFQGDAGLELLKIFPTGVPNTNKRYSDSSQEVLLGGLNDYHWWNNGNVVLYEDAITGEPIYEEREERLEKNRAINLAARKMMLQGNGTLSVKVSANSDAVNNTRKDPKAFYSILDNFESLEDFNKNASVAVFYNGDVIAHKTSGSTIVAKVNGKEVTKDKIQNYEEFTNSLVRQTTQGKTHSLSGRVVMVVKTGEDSYTIHQIVNNHHTKAQDFNRVNADKVRLIFYQFFPQWEKSGQKDKIEKVQRWFESQGLPRLDSKTVNSFANIYPTRLDKDQPYRQDYNIDSAGLPGYHAKAFINPNKPIMVPDIAALGSVDRFLENILLGNDIPMVDVRQMLLSNIHTNLKFTPITKNGETIYTYHSQPKIIFELENKEEIKVLAKVDASEKEKEVARLEKRKAVLKSKAKTSTDDKTLKDVNSQLASVENDLQQTKKELEKVESTLTSTDRVEQNTAETVENTPTEEIDNTFKNINDVVAELVDRVSQKHSLAKTISVKEILQDCKTEFDKLVEELIASGKEDAAEFLKEHRAEILGEDGNYDNSVLEYLGAILNTTDIEDFLDLQGENIKDFDSASYEINTANNLSGRVRLAFSNIKDSRRQPGFAGLQPSMSTVDVLDAIHQILSEVEDSNLEEIRKYVEKKIALNPKDLQFFQEIYDRLEMLNNVSPELVNQLLYSLTQPKTAMKFVMWNQLETGEYSLNAYNANVNDPLFGKRDAWLNNLSNTGLIKLYEQNFYKVDDEAYTKVAELYKKIKTDGYDKAVENGIDLVSKKDLVDFLGMFGISLNDTTLGTIFREVSEDVFTNKSLNLNLEKTILSGKQCLVTQLFNNLVSAKAQQEFGHKLTMQKGIKEGVELNLLTHRNSQLLDVINVDNYTEFHPMGTMRIAGKNIYMYQQPNNILNRMKSVRSAIEQYIDNGTYTGILAQLKDTPITSSSFLLDMIEADPIEALRTFDTFMISLEAIKKSGAKSRDDLNMTALADKDSFMTLFGMYQHSEGSYKPSLTSSVYDKYEGVGLRKGYMSFPTISDSSQLPFMKTVMLDITDSMIVGNNLDQKLINIVREKTVENELNRIADYLTKVPLDSNIDGYDAGAIWITSIPKLNYAQVSINGYNRPLIEVFRNYIAQGKTVQDFLDTYQNNIDVVINDFFIDKSLQYYSENSGTGVFFDHDMVNPRLPDRMLVKGFENKHPKTVAIDYTINSFLQQYEIQNIFAGDLAQYFKNGMVKSEVIDGKVIRQLENGLPTVDAENILEYYHGKSLDYERKKSLLEQAIKGVESSREMLLELAPELRYAKNFLTKDIDPEEAYNTILPVASTKLLLMFKGVQNNLSKRLKGQISPGSRYTNLGVKHDYIQVMVQDVENASETIEDLVRRNPEYSHLAKDANFMSKLKEFKKLDVIYNKTGDVKKRYEALHKELSKAIPNIAAYLKTTSTDAQEYTSWQENLNQLEVQGRISKADKENIEAKLNKQVKDIEETGRIKPENKLTLEEMQKMVMQPTKPLYAGIVHSTVGNGHNVQRFVYVKSSSFPLIPELTVMFPKLDAMRRNIENIQAKNPGKMVRVSYQSANKVGAVKSPVNVSELYRDPSSFNAEDYDRFLGSVVSQSSVILRRENFFIQQDKPFKSDKNAEKGKQDRTTRATQFEKIILGDGINKIQKNVFPSASFDKKLLEELGITPENGMVNGPALKKIYNELYRREQNIRMNKFFNRLGIKDYSDIAEGKIEVMENLSKMFKEQLTSKQDKDSVDLLYLVRVPTSSGTLKELFLTKAELKEGGYTPERAMFRIPLHMTPNSNKMESMANSLINSNNVNLDLPGYALPVASQEGFDYRGYMNDDISTSQIIDVLLSKGEIKKIEC